MAHIVDSHCTIIYDNIISFGFTHHTPQAHDTPDCIANQAAGSRESAASAPLGIDHELISTCSDSQAQIEEFSNQQLIRRFRLLRIVAQLLRQAGPTRGKYPERTAFCHLALINMFDGVGVAHYPPADPAGRGRASFKNLMSCGSVWACPLCAAFIQEKRRSRLAEGLAANPDYQYELVTFTVQHRKSESLASVRDKLIGCLVAFFQRKGWQLLEGRYHVAGRLRAVEVLYGDNGWHLHAHVLIAVRPGIDVDRLEADFKRRWASVTYKRDVYVDPVHGLTVSRKHKTLADKARYMSGSGFEDKKASWGPAGELTRLDDKESKGRNPGQLLEDCATGDAAAGSLYLEYCRAMKGQRQLVPSGIFREMMRESDQELVDQVESDEVLLLTIATLDWFVLCKRDDRELRAEILQIARRGDRQLLMDFLDQLRVKYESRESSGLAPSI